MPSPTAEVSHTVPASPHEVWRALTTPATMSRFFLGARVESDFAVGGPIRFSGEFKGKAYHDKGQVLRVEPERLLSFSHYSALSGAPDTPENYHVVTFRLAPEKAKTRVTLTQSNLRGAVKPSDVEHRAEFEKTWAGVLEGLEKAVAH